MNLLDDFWNSMNDTKKKLSQAERYKQKNAPPGIMNFINIGGGPTMGIACEKYARHHFPILKKRNKGKNETGYDHKIIVDDKIIYIEQKSSGHWGDNDYKWQHVECKHKWNMLLLCGIDYTEVKFWAMNRQIFNTLVYNKKITNQGNKECDSSEGVWFNYSDVKDYLIEIQTEEQLLQFALLVAQPLLDPLVPVDQFVDESV